MDERSPSQRGRASRRKGKTGELAAREPLLALSGIEWERSARQSRERGGQGCPDLVPADGQPTHLHAEVKVGKAPPVLPALAQAETDAGPGCVPVALVKKDRGRWVIAVHVDDFWTLVAELGGTRP